jgi:hypothetical protein
MLFESGRLLSSLLLLDTEKAPMDRFENGACMEREDDPGDTIYCTHGGAPITRRGGKSRRKGRFEHVCINPGGYVFRIGCFTRAPGCIVGGEPTDYFTWFPGFSWACAVCRNYSSHPRRQFRSDPERFYGLILDSLTGW